MLYRGKTSVPSETGSDGCQGTGEVCGWRGTAQTCKCTDFRIVRVMIYKHNRFFWRQEFIQKKLNVYLMPVQIVLFLLFNIYSTYPHKTLHICEEGLRLTEEATASQGQPITNWTLLVDLEGLNMRHLWRPGIRTLLKIIEVRDNVLCSTFSGFGCSLMNVWPHENVRLYPFMIIQYYTFHLHTDCRGKLPWDYESSSHYSRSSCFSDSVDTCFYIHRWQHKVVQTLAYDVEKSFGSCYKIQDIVPITLGEKLGLIFCYKLHLYFVNVHHELIKKLHSRVIPVSVRSKYNLFVCSCLHLPLLFTDQSSSSMVEMTTRAQVAWLTTCQRKISLIS